MTENVKLLQILDPYQQKGKRLRKKIISGLAWRMPTEKLRNWMIVMLARSLSQ